MDEQGACVAGACTDNWVVGVLDDWLLDWLIDTGWHLLCIKCELFVISGLLVASSGLRA